MKMMVENEKCYVSIMYDERNSEGFPFESSKIAVEVAKQAHTRQEVKILSEIKTSGIVSLALGFIQGKKELLKQAIEINENIIESWWEGRDYEPPEGIPAIKIAELLESTEEEEIPVDPATNRILLTRLERQPILPSAWQIAEVLISMENV